MPFSLYVKCYQAFDFDWIAGEDDEEEVWRRSYVTGGELG